MKKINFKKASLVWIVPALFFFPVGVTMAQDVEKTSKEAEKPAPKSELDELKAEWEAVREQQVQMIREKQDQLEILKEEIFSKAKTQGGTVASGGAAELEAQKAALQAERQKFSSEMNRQKESLRQLQSELDEETKQLALERDRFEQEKKSAAL